MTRYISKRASDEQKDVVVIIEQDPKLKSNIHSLCQHSGGHRNTLSIINFLRNILGNDLVSFSDDDLKKYIEDIKKKYKTELEEDNVDIGLVGLDDNDDDKVADYIEHGKPQM